MANRYAIIEDGIVANIALADEDFAVEQGWIEAPSEVGIGWSYDGTFAAPGASLEARKAAMWEQVKAKREAVINGGFTVGDIGTFQSDLESRINISGAVQMAQIAMAAGESFSVEWTLADNSAVDLDGPEMIAVGLTGGGLVANAHSRSRALRIQIDDASEETIGLIDPETGWS